MYNILYNCYRESQVNQDTQAEMASQDALLVLCVRMPTMYICISIRVTQEPLDEKEKHWDWNKSVYTNCHYALTHYLMCYLIG